MDIYAQLIGKTVDAAIKIVGTKKALASALRFKTPKSLHNSLMPGGISIDRLLDIARIGEVAAEDRTDLLYAHVLWKLEKFPEGKAALTIVRDAEKNVPKERIGAFRAKVVAAFLSEIHGQDT